MTDLSFQLDLESRKDKSTSEKTQMLLYSFNISNIIQFTIREGALENHRIGKELNENFKYLNHNYLSEAKSDITERLPHLSVLAFSQNAF